MSEGIKYSVVFGNDHKNPLGALQSLGQAGVKSIAVCWGEHTGTLESSNYLKEIHFGESAEACIAILLGIIPDGEIGVITLAVMRQQSQSIKIGRNSKRNIDLNTLQNTLLKKYPIRASKRDSLKKRV